jgi:hypothetical protein
MGQKKKKKKLLVKKKKLMMIMMMIKTRSGITETERKITMVMMISC